MRKLKFRAWSKGEGCWCGAFSIHKTGMISDMIDAKIDKSSGLALSDAHWGENDLIVTEYIGIRDIKGKDIFEGDIVKNEYGTIGVIEYRQDVFCAEFIINQISKVVDWTDDFYDEFGMRNYFTQVEIIGNIYENPELIEKETKCVRTK